MNKAINYLTNTLSNKCPRCHKGKIFKYGVKFHPLKNVEMVEKCSVCGQKTEIEVGFYYGTGYVSYALSVAWLVATFVAWVVLIGVSVKDNRIFYWLGSAIVSLLLVQPWMARLSRSLWLSWFVPYNEKIAKESSDKDS
jgi:rRNA maturation protein Nop10